MSSPSTGPATRSCIASPTSRLVRASPSNLGPARSKLRVAVVAGLGAECFGGLVSAFPYALEHLQGFGYQTASIRVDGLSSSTNNGRQVKDAVVALDLAADERLVLVGYSKGTPDILEGLATYPELARRVAAVVSVSGSINGSPLADDAPELMLALLKYLPGSECGAGDGGALDSLKPSTRRDFARMHELPGDGALLLPGVLCSARTDLVRVTRQLRRSGQNRPAQRQSAAVLRSDHRRRRASRLRQCRSLGGCAAHLA